jgi:hypothetical protein
MELNTQKQTIGKGNGKGKGRVSKGDAPAPLGGLPKQTDTNAFDSIVRQCLKVDDAAERLALFRSLTGASEGEASVVLAWIDSAICVDGELDERTVISLEAQDNVETWLRYSRGSIAHIVSEIHEAMVVVERAATTNESLVAEQAADAAGNGLLDAMRRLVCLRTMLEDIAQAVGLPANPGDSEM